MKETKIFCDGCGKELQPDEVGFFGDVWLEKKPNIQFCKGCAALICREVFADIIAYLKSIPAETWNNVQLLPHRIYEEMRDLVVEYARCRLGIVNGILTGRDLIKEELKKCPKS